VTDLTFLSVDRARVGDGFAPEARSPLARALASAAPSAGVEDISLSLAKLEVRGDVGSLRADGGEVLRITDERALVLCAASDVARVRDGLRAPGRTVIDLTAALAGLRLRRPDAERILRRLTDLDLAALPAVGSVARVRTVVVRDGEDTFRMLFPQEYGHYVAEVVLDAIAGSTR
jgi:hypothetical protein